MQWGWVRVSQRKPTCHNFLSPSVKDIHPVWHADWPESWPDPPARVSLSTLREIESCPLRWGLKRGRYPKIWQKMGYPPAVSPAVVTGQLLHRALEKITLRINSTAGPNSVVAALRSLGGISALLQGIINELTAEWIANPRTADRAVYLSAQVTSQLPVLREKTQRLLAGINNRIDTSAATSVRHAGSTPASRGALPRGTSPEVHLKDKDGEWVGIADFIRVGDGECEITDFKTGAPREDHVGQLRFYALLWFLDSEANPRKTLATSLILMYAGAVRPVIAPDSIELEALKQEMLQRTHESKAVVATFPPPARPSKDSCGHCDVRQCCPTYWQPAVLSLLEAEAPSQWIDAEFVILGRHASATWRAKIRSCGVLTKGTLVLVRTDPRQRYFADLLAAAEGAEQTVRAIGVQHFSASEESADLPALLVTGASELFLVG